MQVSVRSERTDKLNECIVSFLRECGVSNVTYYPIVGSSDSRKGNLFINGCPVLFYIYNSTPTCWSLYAGSVAIVTGSTSRTVIFDDSTNYSIRICFAGNPNGSFGITIGSSSYGGTAYGFNNFIMFYKLQDIVDEENYIAVGSNDSSNSVITKISSDGSLDRILSQSTVFMNGNSANYNFNKEYMDYFENKYPLIQRVVGMFKFADAYELVSIVALGLSSGSISSPDSPYFYKIVNGFFFLLT